MTAGSSSSRPSTVQPTGQRTDQQDAQRTEALLQVRHGLHIAAELERQPFWAKDFTNLAYEWRRLFSEVLGTFLLVLVAAGGPVVAARSNGQVGRVAAVTAPGLMVMAVILFMGAVSGAHLNPVVSMAFALRGDFAWIRVPGYLLAQLLGAGLASVFLRVTFGNVADLGATLPGPGFGNGQAFAMEVVLTVGLVSTILGTSSTAQNIGSLSAIGVGGYIALAGLWASPVSGASMNPMRSLGPAVVSGHTGVVWIYLAAPTVGALVAVGFAWILRGPGGGPDGSRAAQGSLTPPRTRKFPARARRPQPRTRKS